MSTMYERSVTKRGVADNWEAASELKGRDESAISMDDSMLEGNGAKRGKGRAGVNEGRAVGWRSGSHRS